jgi:hypothetical protein
MLLICTTLVLFSCGPKAKLTSSWVDPTLKEYVVKDILILGVSRSEVSLKLWEVVFADHFTQAGVHAMESHQVIGPVPEPDRKTVEAAIRKADASSVLITHVVNTTSKTHTYPGTIHFEPSASYFGMYGYYNSIYRAVYTPPVDKTKTIVRLESNLYDVDTAKLVWSAQSEALDPKLLRKDFDRVISLLIADMKKSGILFGK